MVTWVWRIYGLFPLPETAFAPHRWSTFIPPRGGIYLRPTRGVRLHVIRGIQTLPYLQTIGIRWTHVTTSLFRDLFVPASGNESGIDTNCWIMRRKRAIEPLPNVFTAAIAQVRRLLSTIGVPIKCVNPIFLFYTKIKKYGLTHFLKIVPSNWRK